MMDLFLVLGYTPEEESGAKNHLLIWIILVYPVEVLNPKIYSKLPLFSANLYWHYQHLSFIEVLNDWASLPSMMADKDAGWACL